MTKKNKIINGIILVSISCLMLVLAILPLLWAAGYSHPCADDYTYGFMSHEAWNNTHSLGEVLKQAFSQTKISYYTWQGTHTSIFLMALSPAVFEGSVSYGITAFLMLGITVLSVFMLVYSLFSRLIKAPVWSSVFVAFITLFWMIESVYSPVNGFFWFNGAVHYVFMHGCMLLSVSNIVLYFAELRSGQRKWAKLLYIILSSSFAYLAGGANYSTALLTGCVLVLLVLLTFILSKKAAVFIPFAFYAVSFLINVMAPGNRVRGDNFTGKGPVAAVLEAYNLAIYDDLHWINLQTVIILLFLIPVLIYIKKTSGLKVKVWIPIVTVILSLSLHAAMNVPLFYAMGGGGLERQENICKMWFQLNLILNLFLIICTVYPRRALLNETDNLGAKKPLRITPATTCIYYFILCLAILLQIKFSSTNLLEYSSYAAYISVRTGEAAEFYSVYESRMEILNQETGDVLLPDYSVKPYLLYFDDISADAFDWRNSSFANWYHVNSVRK